MEDNIKENTEVAENQVEPKKTKAPRVSLDAIIGSSVKRRKKTKGQEEETKEIKLSWYIVQAYSGFEQKVKKSIEEQIIKKGLDKYFGEIKIPQEDVTEIIKGQKKTVTKKFFPGYILVEMFLNEDTWHLIKNTNKVSGFVGDATNPLPMTQEEAIKLTTQIEEGTTSLSSKQSFHEGDAVKVNDGPFLDFTGTVKEVKADKSKLVVLISIFGRATPMELDFYQVEKI